MSVKGNKQQDASEKTAETVEAKVAPAGFAVPSNAIRAKMTIATKAGDKKMKNGVEVGTRKLNGFRAHALGIDATVFADTEALDINQEYELIIVPKNQA
jgi:hypothetical protein